MFFIFIWLQICITTDYTSTGLPSNYSKNLPSTNYNDNAPVCCKLKSGQNLRKNLLRTSTASIVGAALFFKPNGSLFAIFARWPWSFVRSDFARLSSNSLCVVNYVCSLVYLNMNWKCIFCSCRGPKVSAKKIYNPKIALL